ncbi:hypothetical protein AAMO2058_000979100 [Amorphochlora amoebiformis]
MAKKTARLERLSGFFASAEEKEWRKELRMYAETLSTHAKTTPRNSKLVEDDTYMTTKLPEILKKKSCISKADLERIMRWKLARGKFRPTLPGLIRRNSEESVESVSKDAIRIMTAGDTKQALKTLCKLTGVGPATASAILATSYPKTVPFMADEAMDADKQLGPRKYTLAHYILFAESMCAKAKELGGDWTANDIVRALWTVGHRTSSVKPTSFVPGSSTKKRNRVNNSKKTVSSGGVKKSRRQRK